MIEFVFFWMNTNSSDIFQSSSDRGGTNNANASSGSGNEQQSSGGYTCPAPDCGRVYKLKSSLRNHQKWECGIAPQFKCPFCVSPLGTLKTTPPPLTYFIPLYTRNLTST